MAPAHALAMHSRPKFAHRVLGVLVGILAFGLAMGLAVGAHRGAAQDVIRLSEVIPALAQSELGELAIAPAPGPGRTATVHRRDVLKALKAAGRSAEGLHIPRRTRIKRGEQRLSGETLEAMTRRALETRIAPCTVDTLDTPDRLTLPSGPMQAVAEAELPDRSRSIPARLRISVGDHTTTVSVRARVNCPPPIIQPGAQLKVQVRIGHVVASAPGIARQPGRPGQTIRVQNVLTRQTLQAKVIDGRTVEVIQ